MPLDRRRSRTTGAADLHAGSFLAPSSSRSLRCGRAESKAEVPAHAQRMSSLLAADTQFANCRESKGGHAMRMPWLRARRREGVGRWRRKRHARGRPDSTRLGGHAGHARSARRTCHCNGVLAHAHAHAHAHMHMHMHIHVHICMHMHMHAHAHTCTHMHAHAHACTCTCTTCTCTSCTCTYVHVHVHAHVTCTCYMFVTLDASKLSSWLNVGR
jgi:hypothetical protein